MYDVIVLVCLFVSIDKILFGEVYNAPPKNFTFFLSFPFTLISLFGMYVQL